MPERDQLSAFEGDEPAREHLVEEWEEGSQPVFAVGDLDHDGEVLLDPADPGWVEIGTRSEAADAAHHGDAG